MAQLTLSRLDLFGIPAKCPDCGGPVEPRSYILVRGYMCTNFWGSIYPTCDSGRAYMYPYNRREALDRSGERIGVWHH